MTFLKKKKFKSRQLSLQYFNELESLIIFLGLKSDFLHIHFTCILAE